MPAISSCTLFEPTLPLYAPPAHFSLIHSVNF